MHVAKDFGTELTSTCYWAVYRCVGRPLTGSVTWMMSLAAVIARTISRRRKTDWADRCPCFKAFMLDRCLPSVVFGPVDLSHGLTLRAEDLSEAIPSGVRW